MLNQMRGWLATWGTTLPRTRRGAWWATVRDWAGAALPASVQERLARASERLAMVAGAAGGARDRAAGVRAPAPAESALARLVQLKGVAATSAAVLLDEGLLWRAFRNRREIGGFLGFTPTPYASGDAQHEQGISRAGNNRLQVISIQLAWSWVHVATAERAQSVVSRPLWDRETRAADRHRRTGAQVSDRVVAVCHHRGGADGRHREGRVAHARRVARAGCVQFVGGLARGQPKRRRYRRPRVWLETASSQGAAPQPRVPG